MTIDPRLAGAYWAIAADSAREALADNRSRLEGLRAGRAVFSPSASIFAPRLAAPEEREEVRFAVVVNGQRVNPVTYRPSERKMADIRNHPNAFTGAPQRAGRPRASAQPAADIAAMVKEAADAWLLEQTVEAVCRVALAKYAAR